MEENYRTPSDHLKEVKRMKVPIYGALAVAGGVSLYALLVDKPEWLVTGLATTLIAGITASVRRRVERNISELEERTRVSDKT